MICNIRIKTIDNSDNCQINSIILTNVKNFHKMKNLSNLSLFK